MTDGLIIEGNVVEKPLFDVTKQSVFSPKNHFFTISILVHVLVAMLLFFIIFGFYSYAGNISI